MAMQACKRTRLHKKNLNLIEQNLLAITGLLFLKDIMRKPAKCLGFICAIAILPLPVMAQKFEPSASDMAVSRQAAITLAKFINASGYSCRSISDVRKMMFARGFTVYCNNFEYKFDVEDKGGRMSVKYN